MGVRLPDKHGVNPSMGCCFWCGEEDGTIVLPGDREAPRHTVSGYEPCDKCKACMALGVVVVEAVDSPEKSSEAQRVPLREGIYPTGRWWVVKKDAAEKVFGTDSDRVAVSPEIARSFGLYNQEAKQ